MPEPFHLQFISSLTGRRVAWSQVFVQFHPSYFQFDVLSTVLGGSFCSTSIQRHSLVFWFGILTSMIRNHISWWISRWPLWISTLSSVIIKFVHGWCSYTNASLNILRRINVVRNMTSQTFEGVELVKNVVCNWFAMAICKFSIGFSNNQVLSLGFSAFISFVECYTFIYCYGALKRALLFCTLYSCLVTIILIICSLSVVHSSLLSRITCQDTK